MPDMSGNKNYRGRIAPSPTGLLHLGHAATFLTAHQRAAAAQALTARVRDNMGVRVDVSVADPDTIERSAGKMRRVIDQRDA